MIKMPPQNKRIIIEEKIIKKAIKEFLKEHPDFYKIIDKKAKERLAKEV